MRELADDLGIKRVYVVANKVTGEADLAMVREHLPEFALLGV